MKAITIGGVVATAAYLTGVSWYMYRYNGSLLALPPNELGDFLAGFLGPLGFFWLICGYLQQGVELKQNTRALELQVQELQNSVEQQRELVALNREQLQADLEEVRHQRKVARQAVLPVLEAKTGGTFHGNGNANVRLTLTNVAAEVRSVLFSMPDTFQFTLPNVSLWSRGASHDLAWFVAGDAELAPFDFKLTYIDLHGAPGQVEFRVRFEEYKTATGVRFKTLVEVANPT